MSLKGTEKNFFKNLKIILKKALIVFFQIFSVE